MTDEAEAKQLSLFPPDKRQVSNAMIRGALFSAVQGENRKMLDMEILPTQNGIEIKFSGKQLNQDDHDVFMQLVYFTSHSKKSIDEYIEVPANAILKALGRATGKSQHEQLKNSLNRLFTASMFIKANGYFLRGRLIDATLEREEIQADKRHILFRLNRECLPFFESSQFTLIDWEKRKKLKQKDLAKWLQLYFDSNVNQFPVSVVWLADRKDSCVNA